MKGKSRNGLGISCDPIQPPVRDPIRAARDPIRMAPDPIRRTPNSIRARAI